MSIARSGLKTFGGRSGSIAVGFVAVTVYARELGTAALGSFFLFQALLMVLDVVADAGIRGALVKRISEGRPAGSTFATGLALRATLLIPVVALVLAFAGPLEGYVGRDLARPLVLAVALRGASRMATGVLEGEIRVGRAASVEFLGKVVYATVGIALVVAEFGVYGPVYGLISGYVVTTVVAVLSMETRVGLPSFGLAKSLLSYARFDAVGRVGGVAYAWVDVVVVGLFLSQAHVGAYELAWKVASVVLVFTEGLTTAAFPRLSEYAANDRIDRIEDTLPGLITPSLMLIVPALFGTLVLSREILRVVFGPEFVLASVALVILMANNLSSGFYRPVSRTLKALNRPDLNARAVEVNVGLNLVLNVALIPNFGLVGAAVATTTASLVGNLLALTYLDRLIDVRFRWRALAWCVSVSAVMSVAVAAAGRAVAVETALELGLVVAVGVCTYLGLVLASSSVRSLGREALSAITGYA